MEISIVRDQRTTKYQLQEKMNKRVTKTTQLTGKLRSKLLNCGPYLPYPTHLAS